MPNERSTLTSSYKGGAAALIAMSAATASAEVIVDTTVRSLPPDNAVPLDGDNLTQALTVDVDHNGTVDFTYRTELTFVSTQWVDPSGQDAQYKNQYNFAGYIDGLGVGAPVVSGALIGPALGLQSSLMVVSGHDEVIYYPNYGYGGPHCKYGCSDYSTDLRRRTDSTILDTNSFSDGYNFHDYIPFSFYDGSKVNYGWVDLVSQVNYQMGWINEIVYDNTGAPIMAGAITSSVPEPSSLAMLATGLAGLALYRSAHPAARRRRPQPRH